jgi:hypothetical protein
MLIVGPSGCGKSTLTLQLALSGWKYLSDDVLLLNQDRHKIEARGLRRFFALRPDTIAAVQLPKLSLAAAAGLLKEHVIPEDFFPATQVECAEPDAILFAAITHEPKTVLRSLTTSEVMERLLKFCPWSCYDRPTASAYLRFLGQLARQTTGFDILAGTDVLGSPERTADIAYQAYTGR